MENTNSKYDSYGKLKSEPWPEIKKDYRVGYIETVLVGRNEKKKVQLYGYWDGEKATFNNKRITIRTKRWLTNENVF